MDTHRSTLNNLHHVTAISTDPQSTLDFYEDLLGLRLIKRTINFDDPGAYHFYFGDGIGTPGTILTFFPWPNARRGVRGPGQVAATSLAIPLVSMQFWIERLRKNRVLFERMADRFGEEVIRFADPDGMSLELIASDFNDPVAPWNSGPIPSEFLIRGFHSVSLALKDYRPTAKLLTEIFGHQTQRNEGNRYRFVAPDKGAAGRLIDLVDAPHQPEGHVAAGSVHHIAFRVATDEDQRAWREKLVERGFHVSPIMDRTYFHSIYFREPGGVLFEIATDPPGFTLDEIVDELGTDLKLPPWLEKERNQIETILPPITLPRSVASDAKERDATLNQ
jgi:glyoxalase family protein